MYAMLDWDNTLRRGATLFTWTDFLVRNGVLSQTVVEERKTLQARYRQGELSHDALSDECCRSYLRAVDGLAESSYRALIREYLPEDRQYIAPHTAVLMEWLRAHSIVPVIVSGSPHDIIVNYFEPFGVVRSFDFLMRITDGRLDGSFLSSGGHNKQAAVAACLEYFGESPVLSAGDSPSDLPMLQAARIPIVVGSDPSLRSRFPDSPTIGCTQEGAAALSAFLTQASRILSEEGRCTS